MNWEILKPQQAQVNYPDPFKKVPILKKRANRIKDRHLPPGKLLCRDLLFY